jgi:hypothetical protein
MEELGGGDKKKSAAPRKRYEIPKTATCHVCGDQAAEHLHYGGIACYSCRAFFRRTVNNTRPVLDCSNSGNCKINKDTRKRCQSCRFQKCTDSGMKPSWVLSELEKSRLQDCGRRHSNTGTGSERPDSQPSADAVLVKKEEVEYSDQAQHGVPKIKDERPPSGDSDGGGRSSAGPSHPPLPGDRSSAGPSLSGGRSSAGPSNPPHSGARTCQPERREGDMDRSLHASVSPMPRIKVESGSPAPFNPSSQHPHPHHHQGQGGAPAWSERQQHQQAPAGSSGSWDRQQMQSSPWSSRPSSTSSVPASQQKQNSHGPPGGPGGVSSGQWSEFSRHAAEMANSEYEPRHNAQKESLFPFNKMQVCIHFE